VKEPVKKHGDISGKIFLSGIVAAVSFWVFDSVVDTLIFKEGDFLKNLLAPGLIELWMRLAVIAMITGMSFYAHYHIKKRKQIEGELRAAALKAEGERARSEAIMV
jgi:hypothetical protein